MSKLLKKMSPRDNKGLVTQYTKVLPKVWRGVGGDSVNPCPQELHRLAEKTDSSQLNITQDTLLQECESSIESGSETEGAGRLGEWRAGVQTKG